MRREDLRWKSAAVDDPPGLLVSDAELAELVESMGYVKVHPKVFEEVAEALGWVKRPVCGECDGEKVLRYPPDTTIKCPSCGGSGFGRLVALDGIDVGIIEGYAVGRLGYSDSEHGVQVADALADLARQVLAAIDKQEDTDG